MNCRKCKQPMRKRAVKPFGIDRPIMLYECRSALCEYDEDEYSWQRRFHQRFR